MSPSSDPLNDSPLFPGSAPNSGEAASVASETTDDDRTESEQAGSIEEETLRGVDPAPDEDALDTAVAPEPSPFAELGLHPKLVERLAAGGYDSPTPIQRQAIPALLAGRDVIGQAQTGTGKTAAFALPLIQKLEAERRSVQGLILCPTRELALQVSTALESYGESRRLRVLTVYGGASIQKQILELRRGVHVVVGTPGRVKDCIERGALSLDDVRHVVLDEADEMLNMGFIEDVEEILAGVPERRQSALFSATVPPAIQRVADRFLRDPLTIRIESRTRTATHIDQRVLVVGASRKVEVLARLIEAESTDSVLVFARTKLGCSELVDALRDRGVLGAALHGDVGQEQREAIVQKLRSREIQLVVATDVAARGLHVDGISHVINFDPPTEPETYVHRIGRTGRAGKTGVSILLLTPRQQRLRTVIERYTGQPMTDMGIPSNAQLSRRRRDSFRQRIEETLRDVDLEPYRDAIDELIAEADADLPRLAAALAHLATRERPLVVEEPEPASSRSHGAVDGPRPDSTHLFIPVGRHAGLRPADIVGAITNEAGVPGSAIGAIDIRDKVSFIE
ncbi:MAG: DEAD/DEAH box helicase, partial [Planctomycetes bacterium]|nr:DEAD/DEAH box helicase [Planctomycetota bacterium]